MASNPNNPSYSPNLGVLSAVQGAASGLADVAKVGLMDALETRRSKVENDLKAQMAEGDREFKTGQADIENERKVKAAKVKFGRDKELAIDKQKSGENPPIWQKGGARRTETEMNNAYSTELGMKSEIWRMPEEGIPSKEQWANNDGWTMINQPPVVPPTLKGINEDIARQRILESNPDASEDDVNQFIDGMRKEGLITGNAPRAPAPVGIMDAVAADAGADVGNGQFAGGAPQGVAKQQADIPVAPPEPPTGEVDMQAANIAGADVSTANSIVNKKRLTGQLMKFKASDPVDSVQRRRTRIQIRNDNKKVQKAVKGVAAALKNGNIKQISKDRVKLALKNDLFVGDLSEEELQILVDYLEQ